MKKINGKKNGDMNCGVKNNDTMKNMLDINRII